MARRMPPTQHLGVPGGGLATVLGEPRATPVHNREVRRPNRAPRGCAPHLGPTSVQSSTLPCPVQTYEFHQAVPAVGAAKDGAIPLNTTQLSLSGKYPTIGAMCRRAIGFRALDTHPWEFHSETLLKYRHQD